MQNCFIANNEEVKNYIIATSIGYFCKESNSLITTDINKATRMSQLKIKTYFESICNDIATLNKQKITAESVLYLGFRFDLGKYYENTDGFKVHILGVHKTKVYGRCFIAETNGDIAFLPLGMTEEATIGFKEISQNRWDLDFKIVDRGEN